MLFVFFWAIPRRLIYICRRFGTLYLFHLQRHFTPAFEAAKQLPSHRTHSATLPRSEPLPTTTTGHYTTCCKNPQSCAPEDGQKFARNMLS